MGPTCCGSNCPPGPAVVYPNHVSVDVPILEIAGLGSGESEEPYVVSFAWEATSWKGLDPSPLGTTQRWSMGSYAAPPQLRENSQLGEQILLGEGISHAILDFPEVPPTAEHASTTHVKIAGLTMCAFEQDDGNNKDDIKTAIEDGLANPIRDRLFATYTKEPFSDESGGRGFVAVYQELKTQARTTFNSLNPQKQTESRDLFDHINQTLDLAIDGAQDAIAQKSIGAGAILTIIGSGLKVVTSLVSLFKKKHAPDSDDFVGCSTIVYVGVPWDVLNQQRGGVPACSAGPGGSLGLAVCAIDSGAPTALKFAQPFGATTSNSNWVAKVEARRGSYRITSGEIYGSGRQELRSSGNRYVVVNGGQSLAVDDDMPKTKGPNDDSSYRSCQNVDEGPCDIQFAHMLDCQTNGNDWLGYEISEKSGGGFRIETIGHPNSQVGVRLSTPTLPSCVKVKREVVELVGISGAHNDFKFSEYPVGYEHSPNVVVIPEILSIHKDENIPIGVHLQIVDILPGRTGVFLHAPGYCGSGFCGVVTAKVRLTYLYWEGNAVDVYDAVVQSTDDEHAARQEPESVDLEWWPPTGDQLGATLYFPTTLWSGGDNDTGFSVRATGTDVTDFITGRARLYAQHYYSGQEAYVEAKIVNLRFR